MSVQQWCSRACSNPLEVIVGLCIFSAVAAGGAVESVASASLAILLIASFIYVRSWPGLWRALSRDERLALFGFGLYFLSAILSYYNVSDEQEFIKHLGRYLRFFLVIPIYLLLSKSDLKIFNYLLAGAVVSGPLYLFIALASIADRPGMPAQGGYHHITFGDLAMLNAMFMLSVLLVMRSTRTFKAILIISILCVLYASLMSQARGAWLALPFCLAMLLLVAVRNKRINIKTIIVIFVVLGAVVMVTPAKDIVLNRVQKATQEVESFRSGEIEPTSVGSRLGMWHVAINVWHKHPVIGTGLGDFDLEFLDSQAKGLYVKNEVHTSTHNIYFQALATTGFIGFIALCLALVIVPFRLFYNANRDSINTAALGGMVAIIAFSVFGLTESWILRSPLVSLYLLYFVGLATTASKKTVES